MPPARPLSFPATTTDVQLLTGACVIWGWSFVETTATVGAQLELYDGTSTEGDLLTSITLLPNESTRDLIAADGLDASVGLFLHVVAGTVKGAVWVVPLQPPENNEAWYGVPAEWDEAHR